MGFKFGWSESGMFRLSRYGCVNVALWGWVLMVFEFSRFVPDALITSSCDDVVEACMAIMGIDWDNKLRD